MPFIKKDFYITSPTKAFQFVQNTLKCTNKEAQKIIDKKRIYYKNQNPIHKSDLISGEVILEIFEPKATLEPFFIHQDFALYHKPSNLLTHPKGRFSHSSLCDSIKDTFGKDANPIHRLDYETNGVILVSRNKQSEVILKKLFETNQIKKKYLALINGILLKNQIIDLPILNPNSITKQEDLGIRSQIHPMGKRAITKIKVLKHFENSTLLEVTPITGRTHQIRLHLASIGYPIVGEPLYGVDDDSAREYLNQKLFTQNILKLQAKSLEFYYKNTKYFFSTPFDFL